MATILEQIEASRVNTDEWSNYERAALMVLNARGITRTDAVLSAGVEMNDEDRITIWLADSMVWTIRETRAARHRTGLRGLLQIAGYAGRLEGWPGMSTLHDGYICLSNHYQDLLSK